MLPSKYFQGSWAKFPRTETLDGSASLWRHCWTGAQDGYPLLLPSKLRKNECSAVMHSWGSKVSSWLSQVQRNPGPLGKLEGSWINWVRVMDCSLDQQIFTPFSPPPPSQGCVYFLPHCLWTWPRDVCWSLKCEQMWCKQSVKLCLCGSSLLKLLSFTMRICLRYSFSLVPLNVSFGHD